MRVRLVSLNGHLDISLVEILTLVGRHHACDVRIDSSRVSRRHCCLAVDRNQVFVRDLGSINGTWVNGARIESRAVLRHGDEFRIAHLHFRLEITAEADEHEGEISK